MDESLTTVELGGNLPVDRLMLAWPRAWRGLLALGQARPIDDADDGVLAAAQSAPDLGVGGAFMEQRRNSVALLLLGAVALHGARPITERVANAAGYSVTTVYRRIAKGVGG